MTVRPPGSDWRAIVRKNGSPEFAAAFTPGVLLDTSVMNAPLVGIAMISRFFGAAAKLYDRLEFTSETVDGPKTYMEWEGHAFGSSIAGSTILTRSAAGLIKNIRLYHRPFRMVLRFSAELARRLEGEVAPDLFEG